jgi:hypothetical protein
MPIKIKKILIEVKMSEEIINNVDECDDWTEPFVEEEVPEQWRK